MKIWKFINFAEFDDPVVYPVSSSSEPGSVPGVEQ